MPLQHATRAVREWCARAHPARARGVIWEWAFRRRERRVWATMQTIVRLFDEHGAVGDSYFVLLSTCIGAVRKTDVCSPMIMMAVLSTTLMTTRIATYSYYISDANDGGDNDGDYYREGRNDLWRW